MSRTPDIRNSRSHWPFLLRARGATDVGARAVDDTVPERRLRADTDKERYDTGQYVAIWRDMAVAETNKETS